ncbi:MAG: type II secretion system protein [Phycisphaerae bacterium]|nr:type II secretion system protein [Phycisphaerae bacterium]
MTAPHTGIPSSRRGFTLLEMLVAIAAVLLIGIGIAQVFRAAGETVRAGRRISNLNTYAAILERQLRSDFASMTRAGFMLMRHDPNNGWLASSGERGVPLTPNGEGWRQRRTDELVFFAEGDFASRRTARHPDRTAQSNAARIYYGHGKRRVEDLNSNSPYLVPRLNDPNDQAQAALGFNDPLKHNPNQYASDWILLRHVTLLVQPSSSIFEPLSGIVPATLLPATKQPDNDIQIGLQPAASSIFRQMAALLPQPIPGQNALCRLDNVRPLFSSGLVDIATTDLGEIRRFVTGPTSAPAAATAAYSPSLSMPHHNGAFNVNSVGGWMQAWMRQALPTDPVGQGTPRMRAEPSPPDYLGVGLSSGGQFDYQRSDQMALCAFNLLPRCSEFIVEWSFGDTAGGQPIWHGLPRRVDANNDGKIDQLDPLVADSYVNGPVFNQQWVDANNMLQTRAVPNGLIHGAKNVTTGAVQFFSYFGYLDPTYSAVNASDPETMPWAWPSLVRITISLVDPSDPGLEQTYQYILNTPGNPGSLGL